MVKVLPFLLPILFVGCAGRSLAPDERVIHVRELLAVAPCGDTIAVLEVIRAEGAPPRATLSLWSDNAREVLVSEEGAGAMAAATLAEAGRPPSGALDRRFGAALRELSWLDPGPATSGPTWKPPELWGAVLVWSVETDPRYGPVAHLVLRDLSGRGEEVARYPGREPPEIELRFLPGNRVVASIRPPVTPGATVADVDFVKLGPAAGRLLAREAERLATAGDGAAARERLRRARELAPAEPWVAYREAALAAVEGDRDDALAALTRAIAGEPSYYRMLARTDPVFAKLRGDPSFDELVRPRPLP